MCAVVVPADGDAAEIDIPAIAARTREQLSAYKVPTRWAVVSGDVIPTLPSGKFDRKTLRAMIVDGRIASRGT